jgi:glutamate racemase
MLGIFDSGLGGLTVVRPLRERLPEYDFVYLGDQAHVPYGDRSPEELLDFLRHNLDYLNEAGAQAIVVACNTSCAIAAKRGWPASEAPILNLIENAADSVAALGVHRIGVLATTVTTKSGAYGDAIRARVPDAHVEEIAAPALVPLVEAGRIHGATVRAAVAEACDALSGDLEAVVYGCTHYPVLDAHFESVLGEGVVRLDPAVAQADATVRLVKERGIAPGAGVTRYATTGYPLAFQGAIRSLLGEEEPIVVSAAEILSRIGNP